MVIAFKQCRICWWRKWKLVRRVQCILTMIFILLERYVHACEHNVHKSACMYLYLSIAFKQCRIWGGWRIWKWLRRVKCILKMISAHLEQYVHACEHSAHKCACMFLYLAIVFKQSIICEWWRKLKMLGKVQCIITFSC